MKEKNKNPTLVRKNENFKHLFLLFFTLFLPPARQARTGLKISVLVIGGILFHGLCVTYRRHARTGAQTAAAGVLRAPEACGERTMPLPFPSPSESTSSAQAAPSTRTSSTPSSVKRTTEEKEREEEEE